MWKYITIVGMSALFVTSFVFVMSGSEERNNKGNDDTKIIVDIANDEIDKKVKTILIESNKKIYELDELNMKIVEATEKEKKLLTKSGINWMEDEIFSVKMNKRGNIIPYEKMLVESKSSKSELVDPIEKRDSWGFTLGEITTAWDKGLTGAGVKIAILDTGVDGTHEDLQLSGGISFLKGKYDEDELGHGTHVAGIIAAKDDGIGTRGIAKDAKIYSVRVLKENGKGNLSTILLGINWAIENKMDVINMSLGSVGEYSILDRAINSAYEKGIPTIVAVGNTAKTSNKEINYPASYEPTIAVGSVGLNNWMSIKSGIRHSDDSSFGNEIDVVAPGESIISTVPGGYSEYNGTSMSAPYVTGVVALLMEKSKLNVYEITKVLRNSSIDLGKTGPDNYYGYGMVDVVRAIELIEKGNVSYKKGKTVKDDLTGPIGSISLNKDIPIPKKNQEENDASIVDSEVFSVVYSKELNKTVTSENRSVRLQVLDTTSKKGIKGAKLHISLHDPMNNKVKVHNINTDSNGKAIVKYTGLKKSGAYKMKLIVSSEKQESKKYYLGFNQRIPIKIKASKITIQNENGIHYIVSKLINNKNTGISDAMVTLKVYKSTKLISTHSGITKKDGTFKIKIDISNAGLYTMKVSTQKTGYQVLRESLKFNKK